MMIYLLVYDENISTTKSGLKFISKGWPEVELRSFPDRASNLQNMLVSLSQRKVCLQ